MARPVGHSALFLGQNRNFEELPEASGISPRNSPMRRRWGRSGRFRSSQIWILFPKLLKITQMCHTSGTSAPLSAPANSSNRRKSGRMLAPYAEDEPGRDISILRYLAMILKDCRKSPSIIISFRRTQMGCLYRRYRLPIRPRNRLSERPGPNQISLRFNTRIGFCYGRAPYITYKEYYQE